MMKPFFSSLILFLSLNSIAQEEIITGRIFNSQEEPVGGVSIRQKNTEYTYYSDYNGAFHIMLENEKEASITISKEGYFTVTISQLDTVSSMIKVTLNEISRNTFAPTDDKKEPFQNENSAYSEEMTIQPFQEDTSNTKLKYFEAILSLQGDFMFIDFSQFESDLGSYNTNFMNSTSGLGSFEIGLIANKFYYGANFGFSFNYDNSYDSLSINFNKTQYGLHFGYVLLNTHRFYISPNIWLKWDRYRLLNSAKDHRIPLNQYVSDRNLDIRFNEMTCFLGLNLALKFYPYHKQNEFNTLGFFYGYNFKFNGIPWVYTNENRLTTENEIIINNYIFGAYLSFNFN